MARCWWPLLCFARAKLDCFVVAELDSIASALWLSPGAGAHGPSAAHASRLACRDAHNLQAMEQRMAWRWKQRMAQHGVTLSLWRKSRHAGCCQPFCGGAAVVEGHLQAAWSMPHASSCLVPPLAAGHFAAIPPAALGCQPHVPACCRPLQPVVCAQPAAR